MAESNQLHLAAAKHQKEVDKIFDKMNQREFDQSFQTIIAEAVRFYGKNLQKLAECNEAILRVGRIFLDIEERNLIQWSPRDFNAVLQMTAMMLLKRNDEGVLRQVANLMIDFAKSLPASQLKKLVTLHTKVASLIMQKLGRVGTYYTQMKILLVLKTILSSLDDGGASIIRNDKVFRLGNSNAAADAVEMFELVDTENFIWSSRDFLDFYNQDVRKNGSVQTFEGYLMRINKKKRSKPTTMSFDFGLGNLSLSFYIEAGSIIGNRNNKNELLLVELEECDIKTTSRDTDTIEIIVKPMRHQVLDEFDIAIEYEISSLTIFVTEKDGNFMRNVYPRYVEKNPMICKDGSESMMSYRTLNTSTVNLNVNLRDSLPHNTNMSSQDLFTPSDRVQDIQETVIAAPQQSYLPIQIKQEPRTKRQTAMVVPTVNISDRKPAIGAEHRRKIMSTLSQNYDEIPNDEENLPSFRSFMTSKRNARNDPTTVTVDLTNETATKLKPTTTYAKPLKRKPINTNKQNDTKPVSRVSKASKLGNKRNQTIFTESDQEVMAELASRDASLGRQNLTTTNVVPAPKRKPSKAKKQNDTKPVSRVSKAANLKVEDNRIQTYLTDLSEENVPVVAAKPATAAHRKISLRASPKRNTRSKKVAKVEEEDLDQPVMDQIEFPENDAFPGRQSKATTAKSPPLINQSKKREPLEDLTNRNTRKRTSDSVQQTLASKRTCSDFDKLLITEEPPKTGKQVQIKKPSEEFKKQNLTSEGAQEINTKRTEARQTRGFEPNHYDYPTTERKPKKSFEEFKKQNLKISQIETPEPNRRQTRGFEPHHYDYPTTERKAQPKKPSEEFKKQNLTNEVAQEINTKRTEARQTRGFEPNHYDYPTTERKVQEKKPLEESKKQNLKISQVETPEPNRRQIIYSPEIAPIAGVKRNLYSRENTSMTPEKRARTLTLEEAPKRSRSSRGLEATNPILEKFLNDAVSVAQSDLPFNDSYEEVTVNTQTVYKKLSPTASRTIQVQEVTYKPKQVTSMFSVNEGNLRRIFISKTDEDIDKAIEEIQMLIPAIKSETKEQTDSVFETISQGRELFDKSEKLHEEHIKVLKHLHQVEDAMQQNCEDINENIAEFKIKLKTAIIDYRKAIKKRQKELELKTENLDKKEQELKAEIWNEYLNEINRSFENLVESYRDF